MSGSTAHPAPAPTHPASTTGADPHGPGILLPGLLLGVGLGGFLDGILLHQILQWHHMLSSSASANIPIGDYPVTTVHGLQINTLWDGFFHTATWLCVLAGLGILYSRVTHARGRIWTSRALWGLILAGWGLFNLVEGVVDHHLLAIHHVVSGPYQLLADLCFLALGAVLVTVGTLMHRAARAVHVQTSRA
ncbi:DUF2243 domain-containing protein [Arsenicicoccus dermatophilus]|uniref:DUF2243 domain-containing protein n=1 Tax=Arsenicicoccus dermatophilus TaxID=1076331 RepID=UPI0039174477